MIKHILLIGLGGFAGSVARYFVSKLNLHWEVFSIPMGTLMVNLAGSFLLGILIGLSEKTQLLNTEMRLLLMVGLCGGFTTFSAFAGENLMFMRNGQFFSMILYTSVSIIFGFLLVYLGFILSKSL